MVNYSYDSFYALGILPNPNDSPLIAKAGEPLTDEMLKALILRALPSSGTASTRKRLIAKRAAIWRNAFGPLIEQQIRDSFESSEIRKGLRPFVSCVLNPAQDIVTGVCQVYRHGARRSVERPKDESEAQPPGIPPKFGAPPEAPGEPTESKEAEPAAKPAKSPPVAAEDKGAKDGAAYGSGEEADKGADLPPDGAGLPPQSAPPPPMDLSSEDDDALEAFHTLYREAQVNSLAPMWNRMGYFLGPIIVIPRMRSGRMRMDTLLPHCYDIVQDEEDPCGIPVAVAYALQVVPEDKERNIQGESLVTVVTHTDTKTYRVRGNQDIQPEGEAYTHKVRPFAILRFDACYDAHDWYGATLHQRLVDGTIDVGLIYSLMGFIRRTQNKQLLSVVGPMEQVAKNQNVGDPEKPIIANTKPGTTIDIKVLGFDTPPEHFIDQIRFIYEGLAESTGIPVSLISNSTGKVVDLEFAFDGLSELRNDQVVYVRDFERDLAMATVAEARRGTHELAVDLPDDDEVREGYRVEFGPLARRFQDPSQEIEYTDWELAKGRTNVLDVLRRDNPDASEKQLRSILQRNLDINAEWHSQVTARGYGGVDAAGNAISTDEAFGSEGPQVRDNANGTDPGKSPIGGAGKPGAAGKPAGKGKPPAFGKRAR